MERRRSILQLRRAVAFERRAEGRRITPNWFVERDFAMQYTRVLCDVVGKIVAETNATYTTEAASLVAERRFGSALAVVRLGLRAYASLRFNVDRISNRLSDLAHFDRPMAQEAWPVLDSEAVREQLRRGHGALVASLADISQHLDPRATLGDLPDDFGFCYAALADELAFTLVEEDAAVLSRLVPAFFRLSLRALQRVDHEAAGASDDAKLIGQSDILLDLLDLSGYALIVGELGSELPPELVRAEWDRYLGTRQNPNNDFRLLVAMFEYRSRAMFLSPRQVTRTRWRQAFNHKMRSLGYNVDDYFSPYDAGGTRKMPGSPIARAFLKERSLITSGAAFIALYMARRPEFRDIELPRSAEMFVDRCRREELDGSGQTGDED